MNQWKWLLISLGLVAAASVGLVACGETEKKECTSNSDCSDDEVCSTETGKCEVACTTRGEECDDEAGEVCSDICQKPTSFCFIACHADGDCPAGDHCDLTFCGNQGGLCVPDKNCTTDADCSATGQVCEPVPGTSTTSCVDKCTSNSDCGLAACDTATGHCVAVGATCTTNADCGTGNVCTDGACEPAPDDLCTDQETCYDRGNEYCAATPVAGVSQCQNNSCGVEFNSCTRCTMGPNGGNRDNGGPEIFSASQSTLGTGGRNCKNDLTVCQTDAPLRCEFNFFAFSPTASDLPTTNLNKSVFVISSKGNASNPFGVKKGSSGGLDTFAFSACFPEGATTPGTAAFLVSTSGKKSNTLCTIGTK